MARPRPADPLTNPKDTPAEFALAAALQPLDRVAAMYEAQWGVGRLERLVSPATAAKFASAKAKLDAAIQSGDQDAVVTRADILIRGWHALNREAQDAGHLPHDAGQYWGITADNGDAYIFVQHETDTTLAAKLFPGHRVWSLPEVIRVLTDRDLASVNRAKQIFSGATVTEVRAVKSGPLEEDTIPF